MLAFITYNENLPDGMESLKINFITTGLVLKCLELISLPDLQIFFQFIDEVK